MIQGSEEWKQARVGKFTASRMADLMAKTKNGYGASRKNYLTELLVERLTGIPTEGYTNAAMQWGLDTEQEARTVYEFETGNIVQEVGFIEHPTLTYSGASPDGLVGEDGMVEIKCPNTATHVEAILSDIVPQKYFLQMQWQMACCNKQWCDYVSYDPRMKNQDYVLYIQRIDRDPVCISEIENELVAAETELSKLLREFESKKTHIPDSKPEGEKEIF
jgi:putative phage-type endonuclease